MIEFKRGDLLQEQADALVNTVNCVGVMGRGVALQFKKAFPAMFKQYKNACSKGLLTPGSVRVHDLNRLEPPHYVINFPTKRHWRAKSRMEDIDQGLEALVAEVARLGINSVALPPLGCGLGGLDWNLVRSRIVKAFESLPDIRVVVFEPGGAPKPESMVRERVSPEMTVGRAALVGLMRRYLAAVLDPSLTLLEIHKLMYFMQMAGQRLQLKYEKGIYGPYASNLRHVLSRIEGHFVVGFGDAADDPKKQLSLINGAAERAETVLAAQPEISERFERVGRLIRGFESAYGLELLATVHWVWHEEGATTQEDALAKTYAWGSRKRMFPERHIRIAWETLQAADWIRAS